MFENQQRGGRRGQGMRVAYVDHLFFFLGAYQDYQDSQEASGQLDYSYWSQYSPSSSSSSAGPYSEPEAASSSSSSLSGQSSSSGSAIISLPSLSLLSRYFSFLKVLKSALVQSASLEKGLSSQSRNSSSERPFSYLTESSLAILLSPKLNLTNFLQLVAMVFRASSGRELLDTSSSFSFLSTGKFYKEVRSHSATEKVQRLVQDSITFLISGVNLPMGISPRSSSTTSAGLPCFFILVLMSISAVFASVIPST